MEQQAVHGFQIWRPRKQVFLFIIFDIDDIEREKDGKNREGE